MLAPEFEKKLRQLHARYKASIELGELGAALVARAEIGELVVREMSMVLDVFEYFNHPMNDADDNVQHPDDAVPF
jgi:hypothetical protein